MCDPFTFNPDAVDFRIDNAQMHGDVFFRLRHPLPDGRFVESQQMPASWLPDLSAGKTSPMGLNARMRQLKTLFEAAIGGAGSSAHQRLAWMAAAQAACVETSDPLSKDPTKEHSGGPR